MGLSRHNGGDPEKYFGKEGFSCPEEEKEKLGVRLGYRPIAPEKIVR